MTSSGQTRRTKLWLLVFFGVAAPALGFLAIAGHELWSQDDTGRADANDPQLVALGQTVYEAECAACHGINLEGQANWRERNGNGRLPAPPHDETGHTWHHPDAMLFDIVKLGVAKMTNLEGYESDMPGYEDKLGDEEIWAVIAYIKSTWPLQIRARQAEINKQYSND